MKLNGKKEYFQFICLLVWAGILTIIYTSVIWLPVYLIDLAEREYNRHHEKTLVESLGSILEPKEDNLDLDTIGEKDEMGE